ncbi:hypothetical protein [uncultured Aquimarina sp.]|uniref:hypothetical protein n=1 Tax=uncultured Aquimarina sp. TaxID=575652 RepID=UPI00261BB8E6|nr:hypothetical protein [uncultured Aquimarina sp.]
MRFGRTRINLNLSKMNFRQLIFSILPGSNPFGGHIMGKKLSIEHCRRVLEKSGKENLTDEQIEAIRDQLYILIDVELNHTLSDENIDDNC